MKSNLVRGLVGSCTFYYEIVVDHRSEVEGALCELSIIYKF